LGLLGLSIPVVLYPVYVVLTAVSLPIGFVFSYFIMGIFYYLLITPIGLVFRLMGAMCFALNLLPKKSHIGYKGNQ